ncbi:MAG: prephenate dehydrogenase [Candidatus Dormibacteria bacterium]
MTGLGSVGVVGAGQIGTSLGMALKRSAPPGLGEVLAFDIALERSVRATQMGGADRALGAPEQILGVDTILLAIPVSAIVGWLRTWGGKVRPGSFVLDTGSAKLVVVEAMRAHLDRRVRAVGGHPLCGTERNGPEAAAPEMLVGAPFALTPVRDDPTALELGLALVRAVGSVPVVVAAEQHDEILAATSHLPHLVATALLDLIPESQAERELWRMLIGPGFRGATRLASSDPEMVAGFLTANAGPTKSALERLRAGLEDLGSALTSESDLAVHLARACHGRADLLDEIS